MAIRARRNIRLRRGVANYVETHLGQIRRITAAGSESHGPSGRRSGIVCADDADRYYRAFDIRTGDILWETRLGAAAHGYPITYEASGRKFIAVPASLGDVLRTLTVQLSPEIYQPAGGNAI